jgi:hypothetical protein
MEEEATTSSGEKLLSRRDVLVRGGQVMAGLAGAGALTQPAWGAPRRLVKQVPKGGTVTWAVNQDPTALAPSGPG